jgi:hypothetical protein
VDLVDEDGSQQIEFGEFLSIIKGGSNAVRNHTLFYMLNCRCNPRMAKTQVEEQVQSINSLKS